MLKVLLVTGKLAEKSVHESVKRSEVDYEIKTLPFDVASLIPIKNIIKQLEKEDLRGRGFDLILVPGLIKGDTKEIGEKLGLPVFKGPKLSTDLGEILNLFKQGKIKFSTVTPACEILHLKRKEEASSELYEIKKLEKELLNKEKAFVIGGKVVIDQRLPFKVAAEIVDAPLLSKEELIRKVKHYLNSGSHIIDIGMVSGMEKPEKVKELINFLRKVCNAPLSIDTVSSKEIKAAVEEGIDLVVSLEGGNIEEVASYLGETPAVIIPYNYKKGIFPVEINEKIEVMEENIEKAREEGVKNFLCDLILNPVNMPNLTDSLITFKTFHRKHPEKMLFCGVGNITETIDADSIGVNAILAAIMNELSINLVLTTEQSNKCKGAVKELIKASKMIYISRKRGTFPKDLAINLLFFKEKRSKELLYNPAIENEVKVVKAEKQYKTPIDPKGFFKINVDRERREIVLQHYSFRNREKPDVIIRGEKSVDVYMEAIKRGLVTLLPHAAYLGKELNKAEIALKTGRSYLQDYDLF